MTFPTDRRPRNFWPPLITKAVQANGGTATDRQIYDWMALNVDLNERERSESQWSNNPAFYDTVRGTAYKMVGRGDLIKVRDGAFRLP